MKFSQSVDLALHALWFMAHNSPGSPIMIKDLAARLNASESYLARVMLWLAKAGLVKSIRGKKGGFVFKKTPSDITIADVILAIDRDAAEYACSWEERGCQMRTTCGLVGLFHEARKQMLSVLRGMTIEEMAQESERALFGAHWLVPLREPAPHTGNNSSKSVAL